MARTLSSGRRAFLPVTLVLSAGFAVGTTLVTRLAHPNPVLRSLSTNVVNLTSAPVRAFIASAFVGTGPWLTSALLVALAVGLLERRVGSLRALGVFASGHVIATVLTEGGVWAGTRLGWLPTIERDQIDVGISYGMWAAIAAATVLLPTRHRYLLIPVAGVGVGWPLLAHPGMTTTGHLLAVLIGLAWWPALRHRTRGPARFEVALQPSL